jgi:pimeloyl-ACP methyl ester carboxylesterase
MKLHIRRWNGGDRMVLLIHGLFSDSRCWHRMAPELVGRGFTVLAPDLRGHGLSPRGPYSPAEWAEDLVENLPTGADLTVGHSLGGLALGIASERLAARSYVYLDPAWRITPEQDRSFGEEWREWLTWTSIDQLQARLGQRWPADDLALRWDSMWLTDPEAIPGLACGGGYDLSPRNPAAPSLVVAAGLSDFITDAHAVELRARGIVVRAVPHSGHSLFREDLPRLLVIMNEWLGYERAAAPAGS